MPVTREDLLYALMGVQRARLCWCEFGVGNPMFHDHTAACKQARQVCMDYNRPTVGSGTDGGARETAADGAPGVESTP